MDEQIAVPSGQIVTLIDIIRDEEGIMRFRFLAPAISADVGFDTAAGDMMALCESFALPRSQGASQIVVSLADSIFPFGETMPDAVQYFEAFSIEDGHCILEAW